MNNSTAQTTTFAQKAIALLMAPVLCMGLTPHAAWADDAAAGTGEETGQATEQPTVTLTIVKGIDWQGPSALVNKSYALDEGTRSPTSLPRPRPQATSPASSSVPAAISAP